MVAVVYVARESKTKLTSMLLNFHFFERTLTLKYGSFNLAGALLEDRKTSYSEELITRKMLQVLNN